MPTPARTKKFSSKLKMSDFEPLSFELNEETFNCKAALQGGYLLKFVAEADSDQGGRSSEALLGFFEYVMEKDEFERWNKMLDDPENIIDIEVIGEIVAYLIEEYTSRPTKRPSRSRSGG